MKKFFSVLFLTLILCFSVNAEPLRLAASNIEALGVDQNTASMVEELLQIEFTKNPLLTTVERAELDALLGEQQLSETGLHTEHRNDNAAIKTAKETISDHKPGYHSSADKDCPQVQ